MRILGLLDSWTVVVPTVISIAILAGTPRLWRHPHHPRHQVQCSDTAPLPLAPPVAMAPLPPPRLDTANLARAFGVPPHRPHGFPADEADPQLAALNELAMQARIVPAFRDGAPIGFKLFSIRPDSIYAKIGIQNGDIIRRLNGYEINSPDKALEAYSRLKDATHLEVDLEREGVMVTRTYDVVE